MRYLIIDGDEVYEKFEIDKTWLVKVKNRMIDVIVDTEESKYFSKRVFDDDPEWHDIKPYDKRYE